LICFVTPGHLASNPRLVKEAHAADEAGYDVSVVFNQYYRPDVCEHDERILDKHPAWTVECIDWTRRSPSGRIRRIVSGLRQRAAQWLFHSGGWDAAAPWAQSRTYTEMLRAARRHDADLYVAHNLAALPVAARAANEKNVPFGFDAEDFHRGELPNTPEHEQVRRLRQTIEEQFIPRADYVTAASDGIAEAYAEALGIERPTTILNVFRLDEREGGCSTEQLRAEVPENGRSIYWFSQFIGPDRGLGDALRALPLLPEDVHLSLRGTWSEAYRSQFMAEADRLGVADRIRTLDRVPSTELVQRTAAHDVGLALERPSVSQNRDICVTNKLFTYLLAGNPFAATATAGQKPFCKSLDCAACCYDPGDSETLAQILQVLLDNPEAPRVAREAAEKRYNWNIEKRKFLTCADRALHRPSS
jgi:glycosyltransferase involved in cell wall biosynthesis